MEKKKKAAVILFIAALLAVIAALVILLIGKKEPAREDAVSYVMQEENYEQIMENMEDEVREGYFETYMNTVWTFPDGTSETSDAILGNSPNNTKPIRCEILLVDTGELLYQTGVLPIGTQLPAFKLDKNLSAGKYDAMCMVYLLNEKEDGSYEDYSSAGFNVTIMVQN